MRPKTIVLRSILYAAIISIVSAPGFQPLSAQTTPAPDWKTFTYPADGFRASFPVAPSENRQSVDTAAGPIQLRTYLVELDKAALFIGVADYGPKATGNDSDDLLEGAKDGALQTSGAHLTTETKITLGTNPGLQFEAATDSAHLYARIYLVGTTLYQTLVIVPNGTQYADTNRFLDSFQLVAHTQS
jgi:hypothetical protein